MSIFENYPDVKWFLERALGVLASCWGIWVLSVALTSYSWDHEREPVLSAEEEQRIEAFHARREQAEREERRERDARRAQERRERDARMARERREAEERRLEEQRQKILMEEGWGASSTS